MPPRANKAAPSADQLFPFPLFIRLLRAAPCRFTRRNAAWSAGGGVRQKISIFSFFARADLSPFDARRSAFYDHSFFSSFFDCPARNA